MGRPLCGYISKQYIVQLQNRGQYYIKFQKDNDSNISINHDRNITSTNVNVNKDELHSRW